MNILGVYSGHDAHFCLLQDGRITRHYQLDRFTRLKHSAGFHEGVLTLMLADAGLELKNIDAVACGGNCWVKGPGGGALFEALRPIELSFVAARGGAAGPASISKFADASERYVAGTATVAGRPVPVYQIDHHLAHCAQAYFMSPYTQAEVFSFDGGGDDAFALACSGRGNKLVDLEYNGGRAYPKRLAIGNFWSMILRIYTAWEGGNFVDGEGKIMGHAAYGVPRGEMVAVVMHAMIDEQRWADNRTAVELKQLGVDWGDWHAQGLKDFSASLQRATEAFFGEEIGRRARCEENVCLSGGCAYNCVANGAVATRHPQIYVPSCPNDAGLALGACLFVWHHVLGNEFKGVLEHTPYLGVGRDEHADESVAEQVVIDLLAGKLVAWFDGRAESGNRALGHRSILADPRRADIKDIINERVKKREWFRPFAPSVLGRDGRWAPNMWTPPSYYMSFSCGVTPEWRAEVPGVVHVDGTCRPHFVSRGTNLVYYKIIRLFEQETGVPMILNTSFNIQEPIVETEEQARATFARSGLDVLYVNGERIERT